MNNIRSILKCLSSQLVNGICRCRSIAKGLARWKFHEAKFTDRKRAEHALELYGRLYDVENYRREQNLSLDERKRIRQEKSVPVFEELAEICADRNTYLPVESAQRAATAELDDPDYPSIVTNKSKNQTAKICRPFEPAYCSCSGVHPWISDCINSQEKLSEIVSSPG
jgi:hypothetical protein